MVFGGGSGLGHAIVEEEAQKGHEVFILSSKHTQISSTHRKNTHFVNFDLTDSDENIDVFLTSLLNKKIHKLYFCSIIVKYGSLISKNKSVISNEIKWNITLPVIIIRKFLQKNPDIHFIYILSHICFLYNNGFTLYRMIKKSLESFLMSLEIEFPKLKITRVYPGSINTNFSKNVEYSGLTFFKGVDPDVLAREIVRSRGGVVISKGNRLMQVISQILPFSLQKWVYTRYIFKSRK